MPTYDYECSKCKHKFHLFQPITSKPKTKCPKCKSVAQRLISGGGGIIFKGSGFYVTDYKKKEEKEKKAESKESKELKDSKESSSKSDKAETTTSSASSEAESKKSVEVERK